MPLPFPQKHPANVLIGSVLGIATLISGVGVYDAAMPAQTQVHPLEIEFQLEIDGMSQAVTMKDLGIEVVEKRDPERLENSVLGKISVFDAMAKNRTYRFDWDEATSEAAVRAKWNLPVPKHAEFEIVDGELVLHEETEGVYLNVKRTLEKVSRDYPRVSETYTVKATRPDLVTKEELKPYFNQVSILTKVGVTAEVHEDTFQFPAQLKDILVKQEKGEVQIDLDQPFQDYVITTLAAQTERASEDLIIQAADPNTTSRTQYSGRIQDGIVLDREETRAALAKSIENNGTTLEGTYTIKKGQIINETGLDLGPLDPIASGISNFSGSAPGRDFNVRKALNEKVNGILIPPGALYKFNDHLDGEVSYANGWKGAYAIFGGNRLETVPGGGICQASTTIFRAALHAGLEVVEQRPHSMFVDYYATPSDTTKAGVQGLGLDATIYPGKQDLVFKNNTPNYIFVEAYDDGHDAIINFYGQSDGRETHFEGPFIASRTNDEVTAAVGPLDSTEVAWKQTIKWPDGRSVVNWIHSNYRTYVPQD